MIRLSSLIITGFLLGFITLSAHAAAPGRWSSFETLSDNAKNGIDFSWKRNCKRIDDKACVINWKWRNRYSNPAKVTYRVEFTGENGNQVVQEDIVLQPGASPEYTIVGETLSQAQVGVEKHTIKGASLTSFEDAEEEHATAQKRAKQIEQDRRLQEAENAALHQIRQQNEQQRRDALTSEQRNQAEQEERRQAREEASRDRRQQAQDKQDFNNALATGLQSMQSSLNQGAQTYNNAVQANQDADDYLRRQKAEREREAREEQQRRTEEAANQRRDAEEKRRLQQQRAQEQRNREQLALERSQKEENERNQRQEEQRKQAQQRDEAQQQEKRKRATIPGGRYDNCIQQGYNEGSSFADAYFLNTCGETLSLTHILANGTNIGSSDLVPGKKSGIGGFCGKKCVNEGGGFLVAVCPQGWYAKVADGSMWGTRSNLRQGYYCEQND